MLNASPVPSDSAPVDMDAVEAELATLEASINSAIHRRLELIRLIDESGRWAHQGCKSCAHWLSWRLGIKPSTAREQVRVATKLKDLPRLADELEHGRVTYSQVRAITRGATPATEETLIRFAKHSTASQLERMIRGVEQVKAQDDPTRQQEAIERWVFQRPMPDGSHRIEAQLTADQATLVMAAIRSTQATMQGEQRADADVELPRPTLADALVRLAEHIEATTPETSASRGGADRAAIVIHFAEDRLAALAGDAPAEASGSHTERSPADGGVDASADLVHGDASSETPTADLTEPRGASAETPCACPAHDARVSAEARWSATLDDGTRLTAETFRRLACDCALIGVNVDRDGDPLDVGRRARTIPPALFRALVLRDKGCAFPGCTHDRFIDAHHIEHWANGGETKKRNLVCLCTFHHHLVHEGGFRVAVDDTGRAAFFDPRGRRLEPNGWIPPQLTAPELRQPMHDRQTELGIDDETAYPMWDGSTPDYEMCVDAILGVERTAARASAEAAGETLPHPPSRPAYLDDPRWDIAWRT
ncbi:MAG: DUF222 domain-containing protein [Sandaracinaceae bacterium]